MPHRYFTKEVNEKNAALTGADAKHLAVVMRAKIGETVILCDGNGMDYTAVVRTASPERVELEVTSFAESVSEPTQKVKLFVGYPKSDKLEMIIQKATELGAVEIIPFFSRYCVVTPKKEEQKNERYQRIALEAAKQAGRGVIPLVRMPLTYQQMLAEAATADKALFCYEAAKGNPPLHSQVSQNDTAIAIITGSEGGFSPEEAQQAVEAGCLSIGLGPRILRCETAPLTALAAVMTITGNLQ